MEKEIVNGKKYEGRKVIRYKIGAPRQRVPYRNMIRCECGAISKAIKSGDVSCKVCGLIYNQKLIVTLNEKMVSFHNVSNYMFVDDGSVTISMLAGPTHLNEKYAPMVTPSVLRLKVRFHLKTRTAVMFNQRIDMSDEGWETFKMKAKFYNVTQPNKLFYLENADLVLPKELVADFCMATGTVNPEKSMSLYELIWMYRTRKCYEEAMEDAYVFNVVSTKRTYEIFSEKEKAAFADIFDDEDEDDDLFWTPQPLVKEALVEPIKPEISTKTILGRLKTYLKTGKKVKGYDVDLFSFLLKENGLKESQIDKRDILFLAKHPSTMGNYVFLSELFMNRDILRNALLSLRHGQLIGTMKHAFEYRFKETEHFTGSTSDFNKACVLAFGSELTVLNKLKSYPSSGMLLDAVFSILTLRKNGVVVKTKGRLNDVHDKVARQYSDFLVPKEVTFENTSEDLSVVSNGVGFHYAKTTDELVEVGRDMNICVSAYYQRCVAGEIKILYVKNKAGELIACLELVILADNRVNLVQAKGKNNSRLNNKLQGKIISFCRDLNCDVNTRDINLKYETITENAA